MENRDKLIWVAFLALVAVLDLVFIVGSIVKLRDSDLTLSSRISFEPIDTFPKFLIHLSHPGIFAWNPGNIKRCSWVDASEAKEVAPCFHPPRVVCLGRCFLVIDPSPPEQPQQGLPVDERRPDYLRSGLSLDIVLSLNLTAETDATSAHVRFVDPRRWWKHDTSHKWIVMPGSLDRFQLSSIQTHLLNSSIDSEFRVAIEVAPSNASSDPVDIVRLMIPSSQADFTLWRNDLSATFTVRDFLSEIGMIFSVSGVLATLLFPRTFDKPREFIGFKAYRLLRGRGQQEPMLDGQFRQLDEIL